MIDEAQDYSQGQLAVLARYFRRAHFLLLGDPNQAIFEGTATWDEMRAVFEEMRGEVSQCRLMTSYRSTPAITDLFARLLPEGEAMEVASVQREAPAPEIVVCENADEWKAALVEAVRVACDAGGLTAVIVPWKNDAKRLAKTLDGVTVLGEGDSLPETGIVVVPLKLAKGLEVRPRHHPRRLGPHLPEQRHRPPPPLHHHQPRHPPPHPTIQRRPDGTFRIAMSKKQSLTMRSLHYYWLATRNHLGLFVALVASTIGFCGFLTYGNPYVMSLIVDRISADPVAPEAVFDVFGPYIAALIGINLAGQTCSKLQDYTLWKLQIAVNYDLATMAFDCLCNQSLSFHSNRFGGTLVSQTSHPWPATPSCFR